MTLKERLIWTCPPKCDVCGRFLAADDITSGRASYRLITPDSEFSFEEFETLCWRCNKGWMRDLGEEKL